MVVVVVAVAWGYGSGAGNCGGGGNDGGWQVMIYYRPLLIRLTIRQGLAQTVLVFLMLSGVAKMSGV
jgi:hypothetical protein